ncbi:MAG: hypothetical protein HUK25_10005 [Treponema sp.]|nr:hypothetical protein [Treponema sp.]
MEQTIQTIIKRAKKKIQHLDTERILCYGIGENNKILFGRTISKDNTERVAHLDSEKFLSCICFPGVKQIVLFHNHPRSTCVTSSDDDKLTRYILEYCLNNTSVKLYDHMIIMKDNDYIFSYRGFNKIIKTKKTKKPKPKVVIGKKITSE